MKNNEKGYAILVVFLCIIFVSIIGLGLMKVSSQSLKTSSNEEINQSLYFAAEAGLNYTSTSLQNDIIKMYGDMKKSPPKNFDNKFSENLDKILMEYDGNKKTIPSTLLSTAQDKTITSWVDDINMEPTDFLVTFKIYSESKALNNTTSRKLEREVSIPKNLHVGAGNSVNTSDYNEGNTDDYDDSDFLKDTDKIEDAKGEEYNEEKMTQDPKADIENVPGENPGNIYVSNSAKLFATRHQNLNAKINYLDGNNNHYVNWISMSNKNRSFFLNSVKLWDKFEKIDKKDKYAFNHGMSKPNRPSNESLFWATKINFGKNNIFEKEISSDVTYYVSSLTDSQNYNINLKFSKNKKVKIVFPSSAISYDLTNILINTEGLGEVEVKFERNFLVSPGKQLTIRKTNPNTKINVIFKRNFGALGSLEVDGDVTAYGNFKTYYSESIITGNLYAVSDFYSFLFIPYPITSDVVIYTNSTLNVNNIYTIDRSSVLTPTVKVYGRLIMNKVYTEDFKSYLFGKINTRPRKEKVSTVEEHYNSKNEFVSDDDLIKQSPILEVK